MKGILERLCTSALENYYRYGTTDFVDALEENVVFFTPHDNRMIVGKDEVIKYFIEGGKKLELSVDNLSTRLVPLKADAMIVIADYYLLACYPDGGVIRFKQHMLVALRRRKQHGGDFRWMCPLIHISNNRDKQKSDNSQNSEIRPYELDILRSFFEKRKTVKKIQFSGEGNSTYYIPEDSIRYIEGGKGVQCIIHTEDDTVCVNHLVKDVLSRLPSYYYRCHSSYIVNLRRVKSICSYKITLDNGEEIPVPAKKYSLVKADITKWMANENV